MQQVEDHIEVPSRLVISRVRDRSCVTTCRNQYPMKLLNPKDAGSSCHVVMSSFGGGLVEGDRVGLGFTCEPDTRLYLGTQANTRVYTHTDGRVSVQEMRGSIGAGALAVLNPDPLVPHAGSAFRQVQEFDLHEEGALVLSDWLHCGRSESGECFAFQSYASHVRIRRAGALVLTDAFSITPEENDPRAPARFGRANFMLNVYLVGTALLPVIERLNACAGMPESHQVRTLDEPAASTEGAVPFRVSVHPLPDQPGAVLRALGNTRHDFDPVFNTLFEALSLPEYLGFHPLLRKY